MAGNLTIYDVPIPITIYTLNRRTQLYTVSPTFIYTESLTVYRSRNGVLHAYRGVFEGRMFVELEVHGMVRFILS